MNTPNPPPRYATGVKVLPSELVASNTMLTKTRAIGAFHDVIKTSQINSVHILILVASKVKLKVISQQAEVAEGVPGRLRPRMFLTFGTTRVVGRQP